MNSMVRYGRISIHTFSKVLSDSFWARQVTTARTAASQMMKLQPKGVDTSKTGRYKVKIYKNRRKNLTRAEKLVPENVDWPSIFTIPQSFNPAIVPLPIRMGRVRSNKLCDISPVAKGNIELLKIPNFLHLTPPAIKRHCEALKPYCKPWPEDDGEKPIRIVSFNHLYSGPSIRHPDSKIVVLKVFLKDLLLDEHSRTKMILLAGPERYCKNTDELSITVDRCPTRKQNKEYAFYLLTALYQESWKIETWEKERPDEISMEILQQRIADLLKLPIQPKHKERVFRNRKRAIGGKLFRFNRHGKAFVVENKKYGIFGPPSKEEKGLIEREWEKIKV